MSRHRSNARNWAEWALAAGGIAVLRWAPLPVANWLGRIFSLALDRLVPRLRRTARANLAMAWPHHPAPEQVIDEVFRSIGRVLVAFAREPDIHAGNVGEWIGYEGLEHFQEAKRRGKGVLFATAHLGNWELSHYAHALMTEPMCIVGRPLDNPRLDRLVVRRRTGSGNWQLGRGEYVRGMLKALSRNQAVGILVDQNVAASEGVFVDFFGTPAATGSGFAKLAAKTGAAVIPGFALWSEATRRYVLKFYPIVELSGDEQEDTQRVTRAVEAAIRENPGQWLWIHLRWKTRPEPASDPHRELYR